MAHPTEPTAFGWVRAPVSPERVAPAPHSSGGRISRPPPLGRINVVPDVVERHGDDIVVPEFRAEARSPAQVWLMRASGLHREAARTIRGRRAGMRGR